MQINNASSMISVYPKRQQFLKSSNNNYFYTMRLTSEEFENCEYIPPDFTCDGDNVNPPLEIHDVPDNAESLALVMDDLDAPGGSFVHWLAWNIPPETKEIDSGNSLPLDSVCGITSAGRADYVGPCPPNGEHRYFFKLYALDTMLDLQKTANKNDLEKAMQGHIIDKTELIGLYTKQ
jgi:hypothetical protein